VGDAPPLTPTPTPTPTLATFLGSTTSFAALLPAVRLGGMPKTIYTAAATVTGGRTHGHGVTSDGNLDVQLRPPTENDEHGTNPEQLFAVGYAACFEGALAAVARRERVDLGEVSIDSRVSLVTTEDRGYTVSVGLDVTLPAIDDAQRAGEIVAAAHRVCPYSNATRGNIDVKLLANGQPV
jgi:lipoyl-dependent peroxiredoxin